MWTGPTCAVLRRSPTAPPHSPPPQRLSRGWPMADQNTELLAVSRELLDELRALRQLMDAARSSCLLDSSGVLIKAVSAEGPKS